MQIRSRRFVGTLLLATGFGTLGLARAVDAPSMRITPTLESVEVLHQGKPVEIRRNPEKTATVPAPYQKTYHPCPPFCIQPMQVLPGVETVGELEVLGYLKRAAQGDSSVLVVDSRTPEWVARSTIPGSVSVPWNKINTELNGTFELETEAATLAEILEGTFGVQHTPGSRDFGQAKTLVLFCNGPWCGQSSTNIKTLAKLGYPLHKLKWYRGGMQDWTALGLTTVTP